MSSRLVENTIPVLGVRDLARSMEFYRNILGFEVEWNAGSICSIGRDHCSIMLQMQEAASAGCVWIGIADDSIFRVIEQSGAPILRPPTNQPWAYEMKVADPDGNILWLGAEPKEARQE